MYAYMYMFICMYTSLAILNSIEMSIMVFKQKDKNKDSSMLVVVWTLY